LFIRKRNIIEIPAAAGKLREIIKGNTIEIHSASLREIVGNTYLKLFHRAGSVYFHCISTVFLPSKNRSLFQIGYLHMRLDQIRARFGHDFARVFPDNRLPMVQIGTGSNQLGTYLKLLSDLGCRQKIYR